MQEEQLYLVTLLLHHVDLLKANRGFNCGTACPICLRLTPGCGHSMRGFPFGHVYTSSNIISLERDVCNLALNATQETFNCTLLFLGRLCLSSACMPTQADVLVCYIIVMCLTGGGIRLLFNARTWAQEAMHRQGRPPTTSRIPDP